MYNFETINLASEKNKKNEQKRSKSSTEHTENAFKFLAKFNQSKGTNKKYLEEAGVNFIEAIKFKKNNPFAYLGLSYIFYVQGKDNLATKYLKLAKDIDQNIPSVQIFEGLICKIDLNINKKVIKTNLVEEEIKEENINFKVAKIDLINENKTKTDINKSKDKSETISKKVSGISKIERIRL